MDKQVSSAGSDFEPWDPGIWGGSTISFLPPSLSTHPEQTGLNLFHQLDLREKHSSIPEKTSHIYRSSGNRGRLMKCRPEPQRKRELQHGTNVTLKLSHGATVRSTNCYVLVCYFNQLLFVSYKFLFSET